MGAECRDTTSTVKQGKVCAGDRVAVSHSAWFAPQRPTKEATIASNAAVLDLSKAAKKAHLAALSARANPAATSAVIMATAALTAATADVNAAVLGETFASPVPFGYNEEPQARLHHQPIDDSTSFFKEREHIWL